MQKKYIDALVCDISRYGGDRVDSIYFGGGTPSLMSCNDIFRIIEALDKRFSVTDDCEITLEANPGIPLDPGIAVAGVNRLSLGAQSFVDKELQALGRIHKAEDIEKTLDAIKIDNLSLDLMFGIPYQTRESFAYSLKRAASLAEHISVYGLIIEEGTPFYNMQNELSLPSEEHEADIYFDACSVLSDMGYEHYEISNFTKGKRCRHNMRYWNCGEYIGFGPASHSYYDGYRFGNTRDIADYIQRAAAGLPPSLSEKTAIDSETALFEYLMLACRLSDGVDFSRLENKKEVILKKLDRYIKSGHAQLTPRGFRLTERGFYLSNTIISDFV